jgi:alkylated DNA repair dioxygenase AlkB
MERLIQSGLTIHQNYINEEEEEMLIGVIENQPWSRDLKRKTQQYGFKYDYRTTIAEPTIAMPRWLAELRDEIYPEANSCIINHYEPGQGISPHTDKKIFGKKIVTLSLSGPCMFILTQPTECLEVAIYLKPRTLLTMESKVRYEWLHSIPARAKDIDPETSQYILRTERISITFREYNK